MLPQKLSVFYTRDLTKLKEEIQSYTDEKELWKISGDVKNSAGNLCLHLLGNLNHFIGFAIGNTNYIREREKEFSEKNIPAAQLILTIDKTILMIEKTFSSLTENDFQKKYPLQTPLKEPSIEEFMVHLLTHLNYHLGQINYHRRLE
ncbi:MAG TPA: DinB family protein [Bacteroidia bacterium]|nr:DinB family protein [Bacteroidia bacterium]